MVGAGAEETQISRKMSKFNMQTYIWVISVILLTCQRCQFVVIKDYRKQKIFIFNEIFLNNVIVNRQLIH